MRRKNYIFIVDKRFNLDSDNLFTFSNIFRNPNPKSKLDPSTLIIDNSLILSTLSKYLDFKSFICSCGSVAE